VAFIPFFNLNLVKRGSQAAISFAPYQIISAAKLLQDPKNRNLSQKMPCE
jgi:hypothetical protein